jgi:hypothetical protein
MQVGVCKQERCQWHNFQKRRRKALEEARKDPRIEGIVIVEREGVGQSPIAKHNEPY